MELIDPFLCRCGELCLMLWLRLQFAILESLMDLYRFPKRRFKAPTEGTLRWTNGAEKSSWRRSVDLLLHLQSQIC